MSTDRSIVPFGERIMEEKPGAGRERFPEQSEQQEGDDHQDSRGQMKQLERVARA
jgi:hypothetical protein